MPDAPSTTERITIRLNGRPLEVAPGSSVAAVVLAAGCDVFRRSVRGEPRGPLCGMGICLECRLTIDGVPQQRSCLLECREGMEIETDD